MNAATEQLPSSWAPSSRPDRVMTAEIGTATSVGPSAPADSTLESASSSRDSSGLGSSLFRAGIRGALREAANATLTNLDGQETAAAAAERHRLSSAAGIDLQATAQWCEKALPYLGILLIVFVRQHIVGISIYAWLAAIVYKANEVVRREFGRKGERSAPALVALAAMVGGHVPLVLLMLRRQRLWLNFMLLTPANVPTIWAAVFRIVLADQIVAMAGVIAKIGVILFHRCEQRTDQLRRSSILTFLESTLLFYRALLSTPVWFKFFEEQQLGSILCSSCTGLYLVLKCSQILEKVSNLLKCSKALLRQQIPYGKVPTPDETSEVGNQCSICQEPMCNPVKLDACSHIFCSDCISEWFERSVNCPICRAVAKPQGVLAGCDGSTSLLPVVF